MPDFFNSQVWHDFERWFYRDIANWSAVIQILCIIVIILLTRWLAQSSVNRLNSYLKSKAKNQIKKIFDLPAKEIIFLIYLTGSLWLVMILTDAISITVSIIDTAAALVMTWVIVRLVSGFIENSLWARLIAIIIWVIAALKILNIETQTVALLSSYSLQIGSFRLSLLTVIEGIIAFTILFWLVHFISHHVENRFKQSRHLTRAQKVLFVKIIKILLIAAAVMFGLNIVGIDLTTIAIFSSAVGFGVAFGLQKVFSNLVSGIIILMDKSIQPGDVIAIGDTYGEVVNLEPRYVSVVTRDGKAHLIPNELLITEKVENWSYTDNLLRLRIAVGVAYKSDLRLVEKLLLEAADEHPRVLKEPPPKVLLDEFGDSSVKFELRAWIADPINGLGLPQSDILFSIWEKFKEHDIEMPFPQREIYIKGINSKDLTDL